MPRRPRAPAKKKAAAKKAPAPKPVEPDEPEETAPGEVETVEPEPQPSALHRIRTSDLHRVEELRQEGWKVAEAKSPVHPKTGMRQLHKPSVYTLTRPADYEPPQDEGPDEVRDVVNPDGSTSPLDSDEE